MGTSFRMLRCPLTSEDTVLISPKEEMNLFIYECGVLPPRRETLFSPDNIPGRLKNFEVDTSIMRLNNYQTWQAHLRSAAPESIKLISEVVQKNQKLDLLEPAFSEYTAPVILVRKSSGRHQVACALNDLNKSCL